MALEQVPLSEQSPTEKEARAEIAALLALVNGDKSSLAQDLWKLATDHIPEVDIVEFAFDAAPLISEFWELKIWSDYKFENKYGYPKRESKYYIEEKE